MMKAFDVPENFEEKRVIELEYPSGGVIRFEDYFSYIHPGYRKRYVNINSKGVDKQDIARLSEINHSLGAEQTFMVVGKINNEDDFYNHFLSVDPHIKKVWITSIKEITLTDDRQRIGTRIRELREEAGMTQDDLAEKTGLKRQNVSRIEQGKYSTGQDILSKIARALGRELKID